MPRRPRVHMDGIPVHIVQRGHNREPCFFYEDDYRSYLTGLSRPLRKPIARYTPTCFLGCQQQVNPHDLSRPRFGRDVGRPIARSSERNSIVKQLATSVWR